MPGSAGELDRLFAAPATPAAVRTMQDGGALSEAFFSNLDDETFNRVAAELFDAK